MPIQIADDKETLKEIIEAMVNPDSTRKNVWGNFRRSKDKQNLHYKPKYNPKLNCDIPRDTGPDTLIDHIMYRTNQGVLLGNASTLRYVGVKYAWGRSFSGYKRQELVQELMSKTNGIQMIPFSLFEESGMSIETFQQVDKGPEEEVVVSKSIFNHSKGIYEDIPEQRHFIGASLFTLSDSDGKLKYYLFDIDRNEIEHKIFNAFLTEIPGQPKKIAEAYQMLKPAEVVEAEKSGLEVLRQGEWFLIPTDQVPPANNLFGTDFEPKSLQAGKNRPNYASKGFEIDGVTYISGELTHSGREHHPIQLEGWYKPVPSTAIGSFQVSGDID